MVLKFISANAKEPTVWLQKNNVTKVSVAVYDYHVAMNYIYGVAFILLTFQMYYKTNSKIALSLLCC